MRAILILVAAAAAVVALLYWFADQYPGLVIITAGDTAVQFTLWTGVIALLLLVLGLYALFAGLRLLLASGLTLNTRRQRRLQAKIRNQTRRGLVDLVEGRWSRACKALSRSAPRSEIALINYLGAANAAAGLGESAEAQRFLSLAERADPRNKLAVELARVQLLPLGARDAAALPILEQLHAEHPDHPHVLKQLAACYQAQEHWTELEKILPDLRRCKAEPEQRIRDMELTSRTALLRALAHCVQPAAQLREQFTILWSRVPKSQRAEPQIIEAHVEVLHALGEADQAEKELRRGVAATWDRNLIEAYGQLQGKGSTAQLKVAERWLNDRPEDPDLLLALGRLCKRQTLWGKARDYLSQALKLDKRPEIYAELAEVMDQLGEHNQSRQYLRQGLLASTETHNASHKLAPAGG